MWNFRLHGAHFLYTHAAHAVSLSLSRSPLCSFTCVLPVIHLFLQQIETEGGMGKGQGMRLNNCLICTNLASDERAEKPLRFWSCILPFRSVPLLFLFCSVMLCPEKQPRLAPGSTRCCNRAWLERIEGNWDCNRDNTWNWDWYRDWDWDWDW